MSLTKSYTQLKDIIEKKFEGKTKFFELIFFSSFIFGEIDEYWD